ncbi:MAG: response regulator [Oscillospiraceae bacterium]|jgi:two-component system response regulator YesN|nr:response regulator [Oscillospiraceae bacterium]
MHKVMLVDDFEIFRSQLKQQESWKNQSQFCIAGEADNGVEALEYLRGHPVDILVTDIKMPKMDGIELLQAVKEERLCECVILLSEYADFEYAREGIVLGAFDYLIKPVSDGTFLNALKRAADFLRQSAARPELQDALYDERNAVIKSILQGSDHFQEAVARLSEKCYSMADQDFIKSGAFLAKTIKKIYAVLVQERSWLPLLVPEVEHVCSEILQCDTMYMALSIFEEYMREVYTIVHLYGPPNLPELSAKVVAYVLSHPYDKLTLAQTAEKCFVNKAYLSHRFKIDVGKSFVEYVGCVKMQIARKLLDEADVTIAEVADQLHYEDPKYMSRLFKNYFGMAPSDYKKTRENCEKE